MSLAKQLGLILCAGFFSTVLVPGAHADEWNKKTIVSLNAPIEVSGHILTPGTYVFKLAESLECRQFVEIWTADDQHLIATLITIPAYREEPSDHSVFRLREASADSPEVLLKWFYPGDLYGFEFLYPRREYRNLTALSSQPR